MFPGKETGQIKQEAAIYSLTETFIISQPLWPYHINSNPEFGSAKSMGSFYFQFSKPKRYSHNSLPGKKELPIISTLRDALK